MTTTLYELRHDDRIVPFHGELLGEASSHEAGRMRWHEIRIYQTDAGSFVVERVGKSIILGETDRSKVYFYPTPQDVEDGLTSIDKDGQPYTTIVAEEALANAFSHQDLSVNR